jgi:hypothetical protein
MSAINNMTKGQKLGVFTLLLLAKAETLAVNSGLTHDDIPEGLQRAVRLDAEMRATNPEAWRTRSWPTPSRT